MSQPPLAVVADGGRKKRPGAAGLPKLLHKFFFKVLRLRPAAEEPGAAAALEYYYYGGGRPAWAAGVLSSIPEEESSEEEEEEGGTPDATPSGVCTTTIRKAHSDSDQLIAADAAVVRLQVVL